MPQIHDAHIHLFEGGYQLSSILAAMSLDEARVYEQMRKDHGIGDALVVGWEGAPFATGNNDFIALHARQRPWVKPLAYVRDLAGLNVAMLEQWAGQGFVGLSIYLMNPAAQAAFAQTGDEAWKWIAQRQWIISVNSKDQGWARCDEVLRRNPRLRLLVSHLGLPDRCGKPPTEAGAKAAMSSILGLGRFEQVHVKLSGFYALSDPGHAYPHAATWPYVTQLKAAFGSQRLLWASDFSPCLQNVSMAQAVGVIGETGIFSDAELAGVMGGNLKRLLA